MKLLTCYNLRPIYYIDEFGCILNAQTNHILKANIDHNGYYQIGLKDNNNKRRHLLVHRLVALTFIDNPMNLETVNHIDGNKLNNHVSNLEWMSMIDNTNDAKRLGYNGNYTDLSMDLVKNVIKDLEDGMSQKDVISKWNVSKGFVRRISQNKRHKSIKRNIIRTCCRKYSLQTKKDVCYLVLHGIKSNEIKEYFNLSKGYVDNVKNNKSLKHVMEFVINTNYKPSETIENYFFGNK